MVFSTRTMLIAHSTMLIDAHGRVVRYTGCNTQVLQAGTFVGVGMHSIMCMRALGYVALYR